ncbi:hypothetical protein HEAR0011 [Herminiimonas arsenicoxydans]|uniref:Uncharacterized protein n=1 Tax=Herminiimonas arsenicoxydans TaxID=204773 RepID=A4G162_HERAR|nr:hypothetical protein HEAR0011 [Herminiimonas arsenicoxydans]
MPELKGQYYLIRLSSTALLKFKEQIDASPAPQAVIIL